MQVFVAYIQDFKPSVVLSFAVVHLSILTIQRRLALSLHKDDTLYKEIYHFFWVYDINKSMMKSEVIF